MSVWSARGVVAKTTSAANPELHAGSGVVPVVGFGMATVAAVVTAESAGLERIATAVGEAWAHEIVRALRDDEREIVGAWPGTISEAKMRVLAHLNHTPDLQVLADLARVATVAARREWLNVAERDPQC